MVMPDFYGERFLSTLQRDDINHSVYTCFCNVNHIYIIRQTQIILEVLNSYASTVPIH